MIKENKTNINKKEEPTLEPKCGTEMPKRQSCQRKNQDLRGKKSWLERKERKDNETKKKSEKKNVPSNRRAEMLKDWDLRRNEIRTK
jgi:hypothetical protein